MLKWIGLLCVGLGTIGIFLPVLPTTPFLLLALYCFAKSSKTWHDWLVNNKLLGKYLRVYTNNEGLTTTAKVRAIVLMWLVMGSTIIFFVNPIWLKILLTIIGICVTIHLLMIKKNDTTQHQR